MEARSTRRAVDSTAARWWGAGITSRIAAVRAVSTALYALAAVFAVSRTKSSVAGGRSVPWLAVLVAFAAAGAISDGLLAIASHRISSRLSTLGRVLQSAKSGDLTVAVGDTTRDEIGDMCRAVDTMITRTRDVVVTLVRATTGIRKGSEEVDAIGSAMGMAGEDTCVAAMAAAAVADQVSNSIHVVAAATEELTTTVREVAVHASEASTVATSAAERASAASSAVLELSSASQRVGEIADFITSIAGQTHLLALNATIEAARAGDMGRGFAVVAGEVKELARETGQATETVSRTVSEIQIGSGRATRAIGEIASTIALVSENQSAIASAAVEQTATTSEISRVSAQAAQGSSEIAVNLLRLADSTRISANTSYRARVSALELTALENALTAIAATFTVGAIPDLVVEVTNDDSVRAEVVNGITIIPAGVQGTGINEFDYRGDGWCFGEDGVLTDVANTYNCNPDEVAAVRFVGTKVRFYGIADPSHGMAAVSVDGGEESLVDLYGPERKVGHVSWESPPLPHGEHQFSVRVLNKKNANSRYYWVSFERVEIA